MPNLDNLNIPAVFSTRLKSDEQLKHLAYGVKQSIGLLLIIVLFAGAISIFLLIRVIGFLPDPERPWEYVVLVILMFIIIAPFIPLIQKDYIISVTDKRLLIIHIKKPMLTRSVANAHQVEFIEYLFQNLPPVNISIGTLRSTVIIDDPAKPFSAKFPNAKGNREQVEAITDILNER